MNKIEQMVKEMCPGGVECYPLKDVCTFKRGKTITAAKAMAGDIPVVSGGQKPAYYHNESNRQGETITVAGSGAYAGYVMYWNQPIFVSDAFSVEFTNKGNCTKYLFYYLKRNQDKIFETKKGGGVPHVHPSSIENFTIPLPPLPIQEAIVEILDKFESLQQGLQDELQARKKQYEYYRNKLLTF